MIIFNNRIEIFNKYILYVTTMFFNSHKIYKNL